MTEERSQSETKQPDFKADIEQDSILSKRSSQESYNVTKMAVRSDSNEVKKTEENIEMNSDSNKSSKIFQTPTNHLSSSSSVNKDLDYMTPKSRHNLNLLFTESNGKKSQSQRRIINNVNIESPYENKGLMNYPYNLGVSPIDPQKLNQKSSINSLVHNSNPYLPHMHNYTNINPQYVFNNTDGNMSINIQHKYVYPKLTKEEFYSTGKFNRKIEFNTNISPKASNENSKADRSNESNESVEECSVQSESDSVVKKPQPILGMSSHHKMGDINNQLNTQMYLPPFNYNNFDNKSYAYTKMSQKEYEEKTEDELKKKKNFCSCKRSKCLKLYCECFANGEFCVNCNCQGCSNVIGNEDEKEDAFESIKEKNPVAMKLNSNKEQMKDEATENKIGCNCTKSNCSKKYCECYKAGIECSESCRCRDCSNCSEKARELKNKLNNFYQQQPMLYNDDTLFYDYQNFNIEKNSVFIDQGKLFHERTLIENPNDLLKITETDSSYKYNNLNLNTNKINDSRKSLVSQKLEICIVKQVDNQIIIELPKSILEYHSNFQKFSHTPISNKKRKRNKSIDSKDLDDISEYSHKFSRTACETNKKSIKKIDKNNLQGKKLNLVGIDCRSDKLLD